MNNTNQTEKLKSKVAVFKAGSGYIIEVKDQFTRNILAVTKEEFKMIALKIQGLIK